jgi:hypothetical protein
VPVLDQVVSISAGLVPEPALCPGAGAAERSQETLFYIFLSYLKILYVLWPFNFWHF